MEEQRPAPRQRGGWLRILVVLVGVAAIAWLGNEAWQKLRDRQGAGQGTVAAGEQPLPLVRVAAATLGPVDRTLSLPGDVTAFEDSPVYARVNGYVRQWTVDIGARVKAGDLLAEIEVPELHQQLKQAQAQVLQAKANVEIARITYQRYAGLVRTAAVSQQDVDAGLAAWEARKADVAAAEAEVGRLTAMVGFQKIYAPFDGVIGARNLAKATTGALIDYGSQDPKAWLYRIYRLDPVRIYVAVPQSWLRMIRDGLDADVALREYPDRSFPGKVVRNAAALDPASRTLLVEVQAPNPDGLLLPGLYATVHFRLTDPQPPVIVGSPSVVVFDGSPQVAVVDAEDVVRIRKVRLGRDLGATVEILSGVVPGERVVVSPNDLLRDGTKVRVQTQAPAAR